MLCIQNPANIKFIGFSKLDFQDEYNITIIMELAEKGSLENIIKDIIHSTGPSDYTNTTRQIILFGISSGMEYLHQLDIIHRDLKAGNILLDSEYHQLITDFCLSKFLTINNSFSQSQFCGTLP